MCSGVTDPAGALCLRLQGGMENSKAHPKTLFPEFLPARGQAPAAQPSPHGASPSGAAAPRAQVFSLLKETTLERIKATMHL